MNSIGILVTSYPAHIPFLGRFFDWIERCSYPVVFGWDDTKEFDAQKILGKPLSDQIKATFTIADLFPPVAGSRLGMGEACQMLRGAKLLKDIDCRYFFKTSGDNTVENPGRISELVGIMGDAKMVTYTAPHNITHIEAYHWLNLEAFLAETESFLGLMEKFLEWKRRAVWMPKRLEGQLWYLVRKTGFPVAYEYDFFRKVLNWKHYHSHDPKANKSHGSEW